MNLICNMCRDMDFKIHISEVKELTQKPINKSHAQVWCFVVYGRGMVEVISIYPYHSGLPK